MVFYKKDSFPMLKQKHLMENKQHKHLMINRKKNNPREIKPKRLMLNKIK
jgi:hypothetical protein